MRYCPNCLAEYEESVVDCIDCEVELVASLAVAQRLNSGTFVVREPAGKYVTVFKSTNSWEVQTVKSLLESNEIPTQVMGAMENSYLPGLPAEVQVEEEWEEEARDVLRAYQNNPITDLGG